MTFLDEQLDNFYLIENFEKSFPMIRARSKAISDAIKSGNLFKARTLLNKLPDVSIEELTIVTQKKGARFYNEAKRKVKGDSSELQKLYIFTYTALKSIQTISKDKNLFQEIEKALSDLNDFSKKYWVQFIAKGFTLAILMGLIGIFFLHVPIIGHIIAAGGTAGTLLFWFGVLLMVVRIVLNTYFSLKGIK